MSLSVPKDLLAIGSGSNNINFFCCLFSGPGYEKYLTLEPDDMGDSPVENSVDDLESEMTEDGKTHKLRFTKFYYQICIF